MNVCPGASVAEFRGETRILFSVYSEPQSLWRSIPTSRAIKATGNGVPPPVAAAIVSAAILGVATTFFTIVNVSAKSMDAAALR